jgi:hypothetical protein
MGEEDPIVSLVLARGDKAFTGRFLGEVYEITESRVIGEGLELTTVAYKNNEDVEDVTERVRRVYEDVESASTTKYFPVALMNTAESGCTLIYKDKVQKI